MNDSSVSNTSEMCRARSPRSAAAGNVFNKVNAGSALNSKPLAPVPSLNQTSTPCHFLCCAEGAFKLLIDEQLGWISWTLIF